MRAPLASLALLVALVACGDRTGADGGGTVIIGAAADADAILPGLANTVQGRVAMELMFDRFADIGPALQTVGDGGFLPRLAERWTWGADSLTITFHIDPDARWHDGTPVTAEDAVFTFGRLMDPALASRMAADLAGIDSVTAAGRQDVVMHFAERNAEQFYQATLMVPLPKHVFDSIPVGDLRTHPAALAPVGNGRFRFVSWEPGVRLELAAVDGHARGRPSLDRVIFTPSPDPTSGLARVWAGDTDVWEPLTPNDLADAARYPHVRVVTGPGFDYGFLAFNFRDARNAARPHPLFGDRAMRRAITMAVDRDALRRAVFDSLAVTSLGPFVRAQITADTTIRQIPFDRAAAAALLDSLGWSTIGADSVRRRGAQRLTFAILIPTSSSVRNRAAVLLQDQLRQVGVDVQIEGMEYQTFFDRMGAGRFDAVISGWRTTPSPRGLRGTWGSPAITGNSRQNAGRYENPEFDAAVLAGLGALDPDERAARLSEAFQIITDDAAAIWMYETRNAAAVHRRLQIPEWRSDAWWLTLGDWTVDPAQRLPRDARPAAP